MDEFPHRQRMIELFARQRDCALSMMDDANESTSKQLRRYADSMEAQIAAVKAMKTRYK